MTFAERRASLLESIAALVPEISQRAAALDQAQEFPIDDIAALQRGGAFASVLPASTGGLGLGIEPSGAAGLFELLRLLGRANLSVGRIFEGHVNAMALIAAFGTPSQISAAARDIGDRHFFAIWNTEASDGLRILGSGRDRVLRGTKQFCSAAGYAKRAVVTAADDNGNRRMVVVSLERHCAAERMEIVMQGMRASLVGQVRFDDMPISAEAILGEPGDYLREPHFSGGAWRTSAVTLGGLEALLMAARQELVRRGRESDAHQKARIGQGLIAQETARLWVKGAALRAEGNGDSSTGEIVAYVNLARIAVEKATLDAIRLVQQSLGLSAFLHPSLVERLMRDLGTYLRQPAPDDVLTEAASWFVAANAAALETGA